MKCEWSQWVGKVGGLALEPNLPHLEQVGEPHMSDGLGQHSQLSAISLVFGKASAIPSKHDST